MIKTYQQALAVQRRRLAAGKKGRSKAVRRWFKRRKESHTNPGSVLHQLTADFEGCRTFDETYDSLYTGEINRD